MRKKGSIEGLLWAEKMKQRGKLAIERLLEKEMQEKIRKKEMYEPNHV